MTKQDSSGSVMMPTAIQDGEAIFVDAIRIASTEEREAYIAQACGHNTELKRQVEERVTSHLEANHSPEKPAVGTANGSVHAAPIPKQADAAAQHHAPQEKPSPEKEPRKRSVSLTTAATMLMLAAVGAAVSVAVWAYRKEGEAERAKQQAVEAREHALKAEEGFKHQHEQAEGERKALATERDEAVAAEMAAQSSTDDMKKVLDFFQGKVLSAGRPMGWAGGQGKEVTLRKALDAAEAKVAKSFPDRPLAEAAIRELLGSTFLDLEEPALAVNQYERALALREALQGENHPDAVVCRNVLANAYRLADRTTEASRLNEPNKDSSPHATALAIRGALLLVEKKPAEAEEKLRECLAIRQKIQPEDWTTFEAKSLLGEALLDQKKYTEAESLLLSGYEGMKQRAAKIASPDRSCLTRALERLVRLYEAWDKQDKADHWRKELDTARTAEKPSGSRQPTVSEG